MPVLVQNISFAIKNNQSNRPKDELSEQNNNSISLDYMYVKYAKDNHEDNLVNKGKMILTQT